MLIISFSLPNPNIIEGEDDYVHHDVDDDYSPLSPPEVIQASSLDSKAAPEDEDEGEGEGKNEDEY